MMRQLFEKIKNSKLYIGTDFLIKKHNGSLTLLLIIHSFISIIYFTNLNYKITRVSAFSAYHDHDDYAQSYHSHSYAEDSHDHDYSESFHDHDSEYSKSYHGH